MSETFTRLAPFIQEYIYSSNWSELRPVQIEACRVIFDTDAHLLVAAGTASGKTEAAFLPVLTQLYEKPPQTIGAIYIGPIKALINDQFERLNDLLRQADIPVWHWHGDVSQSRKKQAIKNPKGILQITPESLEGLLINKHNDLMRLFGQLQFVVIEKIHAFMGTERGCQILCQLARLENITKNQPRRIGLSATLGDYSLAADWLSSGTGKEVIIPNVEGAKRQIKLALEHFYIQDELDDSEATVCDKYIYNLTKSRKCLIFANNKTQTEEIIASLRQIAAKEGEPDIYHVHHGSISASLRSSAENAMREPNKPAVTAATLTLEVGVDIGQLERVIQLESPPSVASFLQRLGRTGRRGVAADMRFVCAEDKVSEEAPLPEQFPWQLLQSIAIIQLYLEERWIEPIKPIKYPLSLLYHQTMSILAATAEISPAVLAQQVLNLPVFQEITPEDYKLLVRYLIDINHIQKTEEGKLIIGLTGEKIVNKFQFYAVFPENVEYAVKQTTTEIGSISLPPTIGKQFSLAGRTWEVLEIDFKKKVVSVKPVEGKASIFWRGGSGSIHSKVLQKMRQILFEDVEYSYLQTNALQRLRTVRELARKYQLDKNNIFLIEKGKCCIFPWVGTVAFRTLERLLNTFCREPLGITSIGGDNPYYLIVKLAKDKSKYLELEIISLCDQRISAEDLLSDAEAPEMQKYDKFIPYQLLRKAYASDYLDLEELRQQVATWLG